MLTEKEIEVLKLRKLGLTQVEVSKKLEISQAAVSSFEKNAYRKIEDAKQTLKIAEELHLIEGGERWS
jgi:Tfx family DNA-binding protein